MVSLALLSVLSFVIPSLAGWTIVSALWPGGPRILRGAFGVGIGLGAAGTLWMVGVVTSGAPLTGLLLSEGGLATLTIALRFRRRRVRANPPAPRRREHFSKLHLTAIAAGVVIMISGAITIGIMIHISHHGNFDATAIWNSRARFFYLGARPMELLPDLIAPDYPLLLPSAVARGWQYTQRETIVIPLSLAAFFTAACVVVVCGLRTITFSNVTLLAGCALVGTPFFLMHGLSQFADIEICFFVTSAVVLLSIDDFMESGSGNLPILAGLFAGFAACTKNEGSLYVVALGVSRLCLLIWNGEWRIEARRIGLFAVGLAPGILALAIFRKISTVPSALFANMTLATIRARIVDFPRHSVILGEFWKNLLHWGEWWISPLLLLIVFVVLGRSLKSSQRWTRAWRFPALVVTVMVFGFYFVYLFSPYDALWHIQTSFHRLLLQMWPSALLAWSLSVTPTRTDLS